MKEPLFPTETKEETKNKIISLAKIVYSKELKDLSKQEIQSLVLMDMKSSINKLTVSVGATRPTKVQYAGNNYHFSAEVDTSGMFEVLRDVCSSEPEPTLLEKYFDMKSAVYNMIKVKVTSTEQYLHELLDAAIKKDGLSIIGRAASKDE
jgi:hypothetical protein